MALTQKGLVDFVGATEARQYKEKTYYTRILFLEQPSYDQYTGEKRNSNYIKFEATREEICKSLDNFPVGTKVDVEFIIRGTKFSKKDNSGEDVFTHLEIRNITLAGSNPEGQAPANSGANPIPTASPLPTPTSAPAPAPAPAAPASSGAANDDYDPDLGF